MTLRFYIWHELTLLRDRYPWLDNCGFDYLRYTVFWDPKEH